jgi:hypothetical protein
METGVLGAHFQLALSLAEVELNLIRDSATIQHRLMEELLVPDQAQKMLLAIHSCVPLVKKFNLTIFAILSRLEKI